ncbi:Zn-dependent peptidase ImmA (M78 family) [Bradyrhizobium sp. AZCC 1578]|uniref:ImmA/IrrE family metallo-endopeptidase n=1 Tax=Bradyrhizobium sp. AZCC 1578 TaxID=3117027 RepID=UPI002FF38897
MTYSAPIECGLSKAAVDSVAASVAEHLNYKPGQDLEPVVERLGGKIRIQDVLDFNRQSSGSIRIEAQGNFQIFLASHTGPTRDRFTIAHELGHYFLHYIYPNQLGRHVEKLEAQRYGTGRVEWEANWFAAGFLMSATLFREQFEQLHGSTPLLADKFGVSNEAAQIRIKALDLV